LYTKDGRSEPKEVGCMKTTRKEIKQKYQRKTEERIGIEKKWKIEQVIKEVAAKIVCKEGNQHNKEWFNEACGKVISEKNSARERMLQRETRANCEKYQKLRRKANKICKKKKKEKMRKQLEEVNKFKDQNERRKLYKAIDNLKKGFQLSNGYRNSEIMRKKGKYYNDGKNIFRNYYILKKARKKENDQDETRTGIRVIREDEEVSTPTHEQVEKCIRKTKNIEHSM
jgi:hypothetical protein